MPWVCEWLALNCGDAQTDISCSLFCVSAPSLVIAMAGGLWMGSYLLRFAHSGLSAVSASMSPTIAYISWLPWTLKVTGCLCAVYNRPVAKMFEDGGLINANASVAFMQVAETWRQSVMVLRGHWDITGATSSQHIANLSLNGGNSILGSRQVCSIACIDDLFIASLLHVMWSIDHNVVLLKGS